MGLSESYKNFQVGADEPSIMRLAEALAISAPQSTVVEGPKPGMPARKDAMLTGRYTSLQVVQDLHFFSCDYTFDSVFRTSGQLPPALWVGALFSGGWRTRIEETTIDFPADGIPRLLGVGKESRYFDEPIAKKRVRMASFLVGSRFFDRLMQDDPSDQLAGLRLQLDNRLTVRVLPQARCVRENLLRLLNNPYRGTTSVIFTESLIMASLFDLAEQLEASDARYEGAPTQHKMLAYEAKTIIDATPEKFSSIIALAQDLGSNETTLQRQFRKAFGTTIFEYVLKRRMLSAHILVRDGHLSISEISYRVGYNSPANFSTAYKRYFGHSPGQDRIGRSN